MVFTATFSKADQKAKWAFKGEEIFKGKQYKIEVLEDENKEMTIHQLTVKKPMFKNMGKYTCTINEVQTGSYLDVEGRVMFFLCFLSASVTSSSWVLRSFDCQYNQFPFNIWPEKEFFYIYFSLRRYNIHSNNAITLNVIERKSI